MPCTSPHVEPFSWLGAEGPDLRQYLALAVDLLLLQRIEGPALLLELLDLPDLLPQGLHLLLHLRAQLAALAAARLCAGRLRRWRRRSRNRRPGRGLEARCRHGGFL